MWWIFVTVLYVVAVEILEVVAESSAYPKLGVAYSGFCTASTTANNLANATANNLTNTTNGTAASSSSSSSVVESGAVCMSTIIASRSRQAWIGRLIKGACIYPSLLIYIALIGGRWRKALNAHVHSLISLSIILIVCIAMIMQGAFSDRRYMYFFLVFLFLFNLSGTINHFLQLSVASITITLFVALGFGIADESPVEDVLDHGYRVRLDQGWMFSFFFNQLLPVVFVSLVSSYSTDRRLRKVFLQIRAVKQQKEFIKENFRRSQILLSKSLPPQVTEILRRGKHPVIDGYVSVEAYKLIY